MNTANCNHNCEQGRTCDCCMDAEGYLPEEPPPPPMDRLGLVLLFCAGALSGGFSVLVMVQLGRLIGGEL